MSLLVAVAIGVAGCASSRSHDDDAATPAPLVAQQQQNAALEARISELQTSMTELLDRLDVLNDRINRVESSQTTVPQPAEVASHPAPPAERTAIVDAVSTPTAAARPQAASAASGSVPSRAVINAQIADTYRGALMLYGRGKMDEARRTFQQVFDAEPGGELADNALYWIGETYFAAGNYPEAMKYYRRVTTEYSEQNKAPDALFKIALAYAKTSDLGLARTTLEEVIRRYPYSTSAASAKLELKRIKY